MLSPFQILTFALGCVLVGMALTVWLIGFVAARRARSEPADSGGAEEGCITFVFVLCLLSTALFMFYLTIIYE